MVEVNPTNAPIRTKINPVNEKQVIINPAMNKKIPAELPTGPNVLSSLFLVIIFCVSDGFLTIVANGQVYAMWGKVSNPHQEITCLPSPHSIKVTNKPTARACRIYHVKPRISIDFKTSQFLIIRAFDKFFD